jgi:hypothetical protein
MKASSRDYFQQNEPINKNILAIGTETRIISSELSDPPQGEGQNLAGAVGSKVMGGTNRNPARRLQHGDSF